MKTSNNSKNYKVRCTGFNRAERFFTEGKVYEVKNNCITNDDGYTYREFWDWGKDAPSKPMDYLKKWYNFEVVEDEQETEKIVITHDGKTTTATMYKGDMKHVGTARCCPEDTFDFAYGAKLAMERMMKEVEDWDKKQDKTEWRVVNRPAEVGDYIRVTKPCFSFDEIGDILKVHESHGCGVGVLANDHPKDEAKQPKYPGYVWNYLDFEYEVVEKVNGDKEPKKPKSTKYKPGQFVKVVMRETHHFPVGQIVEVVEHKTDFFDDEGVILCEGYCDNVGMKAIQCVLPEEIAPLD